MVRIAAIDAELEKLRTARAEYDAENDASVETLESELVTLWELARADGVTRTRPRKEKKQ
jgi:hypothetical protein